MQKPPPIPENLLTPPPRENKKSKQAVYSRAKISFILAITGIFITPIIPAAIILGHIARKECREDPTLVGKNLALASLIIGYLVVGLIAACFVIMIAFFILPDKNKASKELSGAYKFMGFKGFIDNDIRGIIFGGKEFVAVSERGRILTSMNGVEWTVFKTDSRDAFNSVAQGNGKKIAVSGRTLFVYDGIECWVEQENKLPEPVKMLIWTGRQFVGSVNKGILVSSDGIEWEKKVIPDVEKTFPAVSGDKSQITAEFQGKLKINKTENVWEDFDSRALSAFTMWKGAMWATSQTNPFLYKYENFKWKHVLSPASSGLFAYTDRLVGTERYLMAIGDHFSWSRDGHHWGSLELPYDYGSMKDVAYGNGRFVLVGGYGKIFVGTGIEDFIFLKQEIEEVELKNKRKNNAADYYKNATLSEIIDYEMYPEGFYSRHPNPNKITVNTLKTNDKPDQVTQPIEPFQADLQLRKFMKNNSSLNPEYLSTMTKIKDDSSDISEYYLFLNVLEEKKLLLHFDGETGTYPVPYDWVMESIAELAKQQAITISTISMNIGKSRCGKKDQYQLAWRINGVLFGINFVDDSDWYSPLIFLALNTSLMESGYPQRFIFLDSGDQTTMIICAIPDVVEELVGKYF